MESPVKLKRVKELPRRLWTAHYCGSSPLGGEYGGGMTLENVQDYAAGAEDLVSYSTMHTPSDTSPRTRSMNRILCVALYHCCQHPGVLGLDILERASLDEKVSDGRV